MTTNDQTKDHSKTVGGPAAAAPALVMILDAGRTACRAIPMGSKRAVVIGRDDTNEVALGQDDRMSRRHVRIAASADGFEVEDLKSRNGTFVDGHELRDAIRKVTEDAVIVAGSSIFLALRDGSRFVGASIDVTDVVLDPKTRAALRLIESIAKKRHPLIIVAETGSGKEHAAHVYHRAARPNGPFVAFNCNNVDPQLAEAKLFGALKGSHSAAAGDSEGAFQAANGGVLFLDEVRDLALPVQGKLLRAVEAQEIVPVGAAKPSRVDVQIVCATPVPISEDVEHGRFRRDLFHRLGTEVHLPAVRERPEAIPHLIALELARHGAPLRVRFDFIEACLLRPWPGNVRELFSAVRASIENAEEEHRLLVASGASVSEHPEKLTAKHLPRHVGFPARSSSAGSLPPSRGGHSEPPAPSREAPLPTKREVQRENFRRLYAEMIKSRPGERVQVIIEEVAARVGIAPSTAYEWMKDLRGEKKK